MIFALLSLSSAVVYHGSGSRLPVQAVSLAAMIVFAVLAIVR